MTSYECSCPPGVRVGTYANQATLDVLSGLDLRANTPEREPLETVCIDRCLVHEIRWLWFLGIRTTGCCCGHSAVPPYIGVEPDDAHKMRQLGYQPQPNTLDPTRDDEFVPLSVRRKQ